MVRILGTMHCGRTRQPSFWTREQALEHRAKAGGHGPIDYCEACLGYHIGPEPPKGRPARRGRRRPTRPARLAVS